jgi:SAM-dependent methyltransferase
VTQTWRWYDDNAGFYEEMDPATVEFGRQLLDYADPSLGARLLDVGAGRGAVVRPALARGCAVTAVDAAAGMVSLLRAEFPSVDVSQVDAHRLPFPDRAFDVVTAGFIFDLLDDPAAALNEARRVLRPGGVLALSLPGPLPHRERWRWLIELAHEFYPDVVRGDPGGYVTMDMPGLLTEAGFVSLVRRDFELPQPVAGAEALWELFSSRLPTAVAAGWIDRLAPAEAGEFRRRFLDGAERMRAGGEIALDRYVLLHRAIAP